MAATKSNNVPDLHYGNKRVDRLYARVWGDSIHFGIYDAPDVDLEGAVVETKRRMAVNGGLAPGQDVLEVASGWGATARYLARAFGVRVTATNIEDDHLRSARTFTELAGLDHRIVHTHADFHDLPFDDNAFDVWWCQEATVHATDKPRLFAEAFRVLRPGGRIVFSDQTTHTPACGADACRRLAERHGSDDLFDADDFSAALKVAGFSDITVWNWSHHMAHHFANLARRIDVHYDVLAEDIAEETIAFNHALWRFGGDLTGAGGIGWSCFVGIKR